MDLYQQYIHMSRYSRWRDDLQRRETWGETVRRYVDYFDHRTGFMFTDTLNNLIFPMILEQKSMPSMRALMTAGEALERENLAGFNCSYLAINTKRSFSEALYILMCGVGVGFSCERQEVAHLPMVPDVLTETDDQIVVADSKEGWAKAYNRLLNALWDGDIPHVDYTKVRKAGERLKIFGGRASGPEPLRKLFMFTVEQFKRAKGRKLNSLEVHDLMCMIGEIVVVGGVRRSALISLSNLSDLRMRDAKSGQWHVDNPQRGLANNSVAYTEKPSAEIFMEEWLSLIKSKSGERGIFNRNAAIKQASRWGRRGKNHSYGTNPCCLHPDTLLMTTDGPRRIRDLNGLPFTAVVDGELYDAPRGAWISGVGKTITLKTEEGYELTLTPEHRIKTWLDGWKPAGDLKAGDKIQIGNHRRGFNSWSGDGTYGEGYLLGMFVGDGNFSTQSTSGNWGAHVKVWGSDTNSLLAPALDFAKTLPHRTDWKGWVFVDPFHQMSINGLPQKYGIHHSTKCEIQHLETLSSEFQKAFVRGLFDTDGHVEGQSTRGGVSIRLASVNYGLLQTVQRMLLRFGVRSKIKLQREAGKTMLPDGKGGQALFDCKTCYRLIISSDTDLFSERIGFFHKEKQAKLDKLLEGCVRGSYSKPYTATVKELVDGPELEVWDAEVSGIHAFDANGIYAHNSEIILRDKQLCNLSEVIVRADDTLETLMAKVEAATIMGTMQCMLTNFKFVSEAWSKNTAEEALLGVSLTGIYDNLLMCGELGFDKLKVVLNTLRDHARAVNLVWAERLGVAPSAAITCVKPSGTVSQLCNTASGIHARHNRNYIRTVRVDKKDPLYHFMVAKGFYVEDDAFRADSTAVISFPMSAPAEAITRDQVPALKALDLWMLYQQEWCEHKPSITVSVGDDEWMEVGAWVFKNFDDVSGVSFLPRSDHSYQQAPYQDLTPQEYTEWLALHPQPDIDWTELAKFESTDNTVSAQTLACVSGLCDLPNT